MNDPDPTYAFRLAMSYLEKIERDIENWTEVRRSQKLDVTRYDQVRAAYAAHQRNAQQVVDEHRAIAKAQLRPLQQELREQSRAQKKLSEQLMAGTVTAQKANERNRAYTQRIVELEESLRSAQAIVDAETTEDIGGRIELTIEEFEKKLIPPKPYQKESPLTVLRSKDVLLMGGLTLLAVGMAAYVFFSGGAVQAPAFSVERNESRPAFIYVNVRNIDARPLWLYAPWPNGISKTPPGASAPRASFGLLLYAIEEDDDTPRIVPDSLGCWTYRSMEMQDSGPIQVRTRRTTTVVLNTIKLRDLGIEASSVSVHLVRRGGEELGSFQIDLAPPPRQRPGGARRGGPREN